MIIDFIIGIVDYIIIFVITTLAVFFGILSAIAVSISYIAEKVGERTHPNRREYMNENEKRYRRKTV